MAPRDLSKECYYCGAQYPMPHRDSCSDTRKMAAEMEGRHSSGPDYSPYTTIRIPKTERHHRSSSGDYFRHSPIRIPKTERPSSFREPTGHRQMAGGDYLPYSPIRVPGEFRKDIGNRKTGRGDYAPPSPIRVPKDEYPPAFPNRSRGSKRSRRPIAEIEVIHGRPSSSGDYRPLSPIRAPSDEDLEFLDQWVSKLSRRPITETEVIHGRPSSRGDYRPLSPIRIPRDERPTVLPEEPWRPKRANRPDPTTEVTAGHGRPGNGRPSSPAFRGDRIRDIQPSRLSPSSSPRILPNDHAIKIITYWGRATTWDKLIKSPSFEFIELPATSKLVEQQNNNVTDHDGNHDPKPSKKLPVIHLYADHPIPSRYLNQLSYYQLNCLIHHLRDNVLDKRSKSNHSPEFRIQAKKTCDRSMRMQKQRRIEEKV